ncbi:heterokaryon incompatibility protein-domain-containing protein [Podospora aff. communis PSN243]|uniref:Heterokaryon incompatibility protein-domain-containing protein n=1 Tax=Podospora aff. communis PSN243 TaxID=3040156 RepID=A0AAV9G9R4_9PEZI|nr:heterokaryon incompatibility protein-domain-containing protein [Podospora aff. communis PSN243]
MRLLRADPVGSFRLEEFSTGKLPPYAILSHTWGNEEIQYAANQCRKDGYDYFWIDTVCIDKSNSAELSEALNSMYKWYQNAEICYAYLSDELLAPREISFFSHDWSSLGTRTQLRDELSAITNIPMDVLSGKGLSKCSLAQRMSWAAHRKTTRPEDMAYCLMGIFDVNMPLLYGEGGERAFLRLQEEIAKRSYDQSIFAWRLPHRYAVSGLFAPSPAAFSSSQHIVPCRTQGQATHYSLTNRGLQISSPLARHLGNGLYAMLLDCKDQNTEPPYR